MIHLNIPVHDSDNHSTHSVGGIEGVVASNKVVSTRKNARSAHIEISKVERFTVRGGRKGESLAARRPQLCHEVKACWSIFMYSQARAWYFLKFSLLLSPSFILQRFALFDVCARLSCMLELSGTYRV